MSSEWEAAKKKHNQLKMEDIEVTAEDLAKLDDWSRYDTVATLAVTESFKPSNKAVRLFTELADELGLQIELQAYNGYAMKQLKSRDVIEKTIRTNKYYQMKRQLEEEMNALADQAADDNVTGKF